VCLCVSVCGVWSVCVCVSIYGCEGLNKPPAQEASHQKTCDATNENQLQLYN
jgi:hypothetical protein